MESDEKWQTVKKSVLGLVRKDLFPACFLHISQITFLWARRWSSALYTHIARHQTFEWPFYVLNVNLLINVNLIPKFILMQAIVPLEFTRYFAG